MMRWLLMLLGYAILQVIVWIITPLLPLFSAKRTGWCDNHSYEAVAPRLPKRQAWLDTPDNSLGRDGNHMNKYGESYLSKVVGLYKNSMYGFKWGPMSCPIDLDDYEVTGDTDINYHTGKFGVLHIKSGPYWQKKSVIESKFFKDRAWVLNFGWLLDDKSQLRALFMCSPRLVKLKGESAHG
jgi:hypothetical protein